MASIETEMPPMHAAESGGGGGNNGVADNGSQSSNGNANGGSNTVSSGPHSNGSGVGDAGQTVANSNSNNTISAAADSSDNQPGTPQPPTNGQLIGNNNEQQQQQQQLGHNPYAMYTTVATTTNGSVGGLPHMYGGSIYATAGGQPDMQQQQQQQPPYSSYLNSFEQFYHQQQQQQQVGAALDYGLMYGAGGGNSNGSSEYKSNHSAAGSVRYHPYLNTPTSCGPADGSNRNGTPENVSNGVAGAGALPLPQSSAAVSTTTNSLSPRIVSSSSPTSTSTHMQLSGSSATGSPGGNCKLQCKKCGLMCASENELQEHITNVHGASPYGSSGYASSPYIKEELSSGSQQQSTATQGGQGGNPGELLDLDSQKMVYPPAPGSIQSLLHHPHQMHDPVGGSDPLHSMHSMQQRALPGWEQPQAPNNGIPEGMSPYMQQQQPTQPQQQADLSGKPTHANQSPYYSPKQSPYHVPGSMPNGAGGMGIKQEYGLIKSEYPDSQNYVDKSFDPTVTADICQQPPPSVQQQQQQMMPVSSSPAEFPSTTTGPQDPQQQYRGFEPPSSSSVNTVSLPTKAATWKSNEARRPKTYNCTACNKWFTSSGHLKRHYNTTLHKNAVKSSGQPDPATLPISAHHHPARDPTTTTKAHSRRNNASAAAAAAAAAAAQQQQPPAPVQPPEPPRGSPDFAQGAGMGMSQYSASPSPTQQQQVQMNGLPYGANPGGYQPQSQYLNQVQSSTNSHSPSHINVPGMSPNNNTQTVLNGHPNGLAGPSAPVTPLPMPSSHTRGLLNKTTTIITKSEPLEDNYPHNSNNSTMHIRSPQLEADLDTDQELDSTLSSEAPERSQMDMEMLQQQQQQQMEEEAAATAAVAAEQAQEAEVQLQRHRQAQAELERGEELEVFPHQLLEELEGPQRHYHNNTPTYNPASEHNMRALSPLITSHQAYLQEQVQRPPRMVDSIFSHMQQPPAAVTMPANIMDPQYNILPLGINTPPLLSSSMQLLPPQPPITNTSTATMVNMGNIHMLHNHHHHHTQEAVQEQQPEQLVLPSMRSMLLNSTNIQSPVDHINSITPQLLPSITTTTTQPLLPPLQQQPQLHTTNTIPSYQQLQPESELAPLEPTMTYHTIIGNESSSSGEEGEGVVTVNSSGSSENNDYIQLSTMDAYGGLQQQQMITADGQILQFMSSSLLGQSYYALPPRTTIRESYPRSPQEGDLPPAHTLLGNGLHEQEQLYLQESSQTMNGGVDAPYSPKEDLQSTNSVETVKSEMHVTTTSHDEGLHCSTDSVHSSTVASDNVSSSSNNENLNATVVAATATKTAPAKPRRLAKRQPPSKRKISPSQCTTTPRSITLPNGRVKCLECDKEFSKNCYLTQHNKSFHSGEYPYRCNTCGKRFQSSDVHLVHTSRHRATDKPHKCDQCPKQFYHKTDLRRHIDAIHTGMKQHVCTLCDKSFCRRDHLRKHIETHSRPRVVAKRVFKAIVNEGLFDMSTLEKPYRPHEEQKQNQVQDANNVDMDQCTEPKQPKAKRRKKDTTAAVECLIQANNIKREGVEMPPPLYTAPRRRLTSTTVSGAMDEGNYTLSSTDESYLENDSQIDTDSNWGDEDTSYIVKEEPYADGIPYTNVMAEKQLSAYF
ncbi:methylcytosine dioxygenase TET isoform X1 [Zeugodacus cucurbitae]|uniref:methylcytosine dioxygenase TET isoform X1 n=1 Tax=Zeugodacus cucurbitae TaxID=28588 RepID=UPI0023D95BF5|nr:methylcytosine dioxygenase TET isoform X1 [Zeugodacus cucurbitae]XP_054086885.1 methylcytosine dioxygenase TET isoform X1 [Zeugodacus cucurbitae]XP_054086887.1 methylcytosine dioxygenase TET isoform X1 [Zeugodacus cucurbitae]